MTSVRDKTEQSLGAPAEIALLAELMSRFEVRDLSHVLEEGIPFFPTHSRYYHMAASRADDPAVMFQILMHEHNGTHMDAPAHYIREGPDLARHFLQSVAANALIGPACAIDVSDAPPRLLPVTAISAWETRHGPITEGEGVIFNFGWHRKWKLGTDGQEFIAEWPGLSREAAEYLRDRRVRAVGTDCLSIDCSNSTEIPAHDSFLRNGILIMENLAALDGLPPRFFFIAAPLRIRDGSGSPIRALALIPGIRK
jgi:kynurenine formamidase